MAKIEVPQEQNSVLEGHQKVMYTLENESFTTKNYGSEAEAFATQVAVEEFEMLTKNALESFIAGKRSPLEFFIYKNRMDLATVAAATGFFRFQIKRHCKPSVFAKLSDKKLQKYADLFAVEIQTLRSFDGTF